MRHPLNTTNIKTIFFLFFAFSLLIVRKCKNIIFIIYNGHYDVGREDDPEVAIEPRIPLVVGGGHVVKQKSKETTRRLTEALNLLTSSKLKLTPGNLNFLGEVIIPSQSLEETYMQGLKSITLKMGDSSQ